jgi:hypothetical protein
MAIYTIDNSSLAGFRANLEDVNGFPAVCYTNLTNNSVWYSRALNAQGTDWGTPKLIAISTFGIVSLSMSVISGRPAIVWSNGSTLIQYHRSDDINGDNWTNPSVGLSATGGDWLTLLEINGFPAISYRAKLTQYTTYLISDSIDGSTWNNPPVPVHSIAASFQNMAIINGNPAIIYIAVAFPQKNYYIRSDSIDGSTWNNPPVETGPQGVLPYGLLEANGKPAYFWSYSNDLRYQRSDSADGSTWNGFVSSVDTLNPTSKQNAQSAIINGNPAVIYYESTGLGSTSGMRYKRSLDVDGVNWPINSTFLQNGTQDSRSLGIVDGKPAFPFKSSAEIAIAEDVDGDVWILDSSSSSTESSQSSSSSLPDKFTEVLNQIIAGNNPDNLIPFTYTPEGGFDYEGDDQTIQFQFRTVNNEFFNYDTLLNPTTPTEIESASNCYVPQDDDVNIKHDPIFYVDLIVKDSSVKSASVRSQEEKYKEESVKYSFIIPKFTWSKDLITDAIASNVAYTPLTDAAGSFWAGTASDKLYKIEYNSNVAAEAFSTDEEGTIRNLLVNPNGDQMYVTTDEKLKKYTIGHYIDGSDQPQLLFTENSSVDNIYKIMSWYDSNIWSALPELGTIQELDPEFLTEEDEISGFDAPFKIVRSDYHNATFVAGTNVLWKYDGSIQAVYAIEGYEISDFDISRNGQLCIALNSADDSYLRILDSNFFRLLINERITNGTARFCKFCSNDFLYGLTEIDSGGDQFIAQHHTYNTLNGDYNITQSPNTLFTPVTEETPTPATQPVEIEYPNGEENLLLGSEVDLLWKSNKSVNDSIKIELYKDETFLRTITDSTPNTGVFTWKVPATLEVSSDYKIRMEWLANEVNTANEDFSDDNFNIVDAFPSSSETEIEFFGSIGVDYDKQNNQMVIVLQSGLVGLLSFDDFSFQGWIDSGIIDFTAMVVKNEQIKEIGDVSKVRIFVGSQPYLSDKWDSGVIETNMASIYYGGGDNLTPGEQYYVNIQVYSADSGWSEVQTKKWIMPKN